MNDDFPKSFTSCVLPNKTDIQHFVRKHKRSELLGQVVIHRRESDAQQQTVSKTAEQRRDLSLQNVFLSDCLLL